MEKAADVNGEPEHRIRRGRFSLASSGLLTALILAVVLGCLGLVWSAHLRGRLHKLSSTVVPPDTSIVPTPGGQESIDLHLNSAGAGITPQFTGLTMLPGVGMGVLQLTLDLPGREPQGILNGTPMKDLGNAIDPRTNLPKTSLLLTLFSLKLLKGSNDSAGTELLGPRPASQVHTDILPGGTGATATFAATPPPRPDGTTPPTLPIETTVAGTISDRGLDVSIVARNVSPDPQPVVLSWAPQFLLPTGGLDKLRLTGPENSAVSSFSRSGANPNEVALTGKSFHRTWNDLKHTYLSAGPELVLRNQTDGYTLRMTALTPSIRSMAVEALAGAGTIAVQFSTSPISGQGDAQPTIIAPGESLRWRVRIQPTANQSYVAPLN